MKLSKITLTLVIAASLSACVQNEATKQQGITKVEEQKKQKNKISIAYKKFELDNGLTLLLHEDHSDPLVHVNVTYHVGSARESIGKSGFAHLFEHLMFQGSKHVGDDEHFKLVTEAGGTLNGKTTYDTTQYYQTIPANQIEKVLWLESDRMGFFVQGITQEKFEVQRDAVRNERASSIDNIPYIRADELMNQALYEYGHPYSWPVIGHIADLNRADSKDLRTFFKRWYGPNNATLTVGGAITEAEILPMVEKYFGSIPRGEKVDRATKKPALLGQDRYVSYQDNVQFPMLYKAYPTVYAEHDDVPALDALAYFMGGNQSSLLHRALIETQQATEIDMFHECKELACEIKFRAILAKESGKSLLDLEQSLFSMWDTFEQRGVIQADVEKFIANEEVKIIEQLQSVAGKSSMLVDNFVVRNDANFLTQHLARVRNLKAEDVMAAYRKYIKSKASATVSVVPRGRPDMVVKKDNYTPTFFEPNTAQRESLINVELPTIIDTFDRSVMPNAGKELTTEPPRLWDSQLNNGLEVLAIQSEELPTTHLKLRIPAGFLYDTPGQSGLAQLTALMLLESTTSHSASTIAERFTALGFETQVDVNGSYIELSLSGKSTHFDEALDLMTERLFSPKFEDTEFERVKSRLIHVLTHRSKNASYLVDNQFQKLLFGDGNYGVFALGKLGELKTITKAQVQDFYQKQVKPRGAKLLLVSDLNKSSLLSSISSAFTSWHGKPEYAKSSPISYPVNGEHIHLIDVPGATQAELRVGRVAMPFDFSGEFAENTMMNFAFSGSFNSRLMLNLREAKGYTYSVRGEFQGDQDTGIYKLSAGIRPDAIAHTINEIKREMMEMQVRGLNDQEVSFMKHALYQHNALQYETPQAKIAFLGKMKEFNLDEVAIENRRSLIKNISKAQLNVRAKQSLDPSQMVFVVAGDMKILKPQLQQAGFSVKPLSL